MLDPPKLRPTSATAGLTAAGRTAGAEILRCAQNDGSQNDGSQNDAVASATGTSQLLARRRVAAGLIALIIVAGAVRLPGVNRPLLGNFATKNAVNGMIARNWALGRAPAWRPTLDCLAGGERSLHLLEVPVADYLAGGAWRLLGGSLDAWGRMVSIGFSMASVGLLFSLVRRWHGGHSPHAAWAAAATLALSPASIIYGQSFMVEASAVFFTLATLWCWTVWLEDRRWLALAGAAASLALLLLTKVYMVVLLLPLAAMLLRASLNFGHSVILSAAKDLAGREARFFAALRMTSSFAAIAVAIVPAALWLVYVWRLTDPANPAAAGVYYSLRDSADAHGFPHPLLTSAAFYWRLLRDLGGVALTPIGLGLAIIGLWHPGARRHWPWLLSMIALVLLMPRKFHEMNYYYLVILPPLCVLAGLGWQLVAQRWRPSRLWVATILLAAAAVSLRFAARPAFVTPEEDRAVVAAAVAVRELTTPDQPVATLHGTTLDLLYYCDRPGWALSGERGRLPARLAECRQQGAKLLAVAGLAQLDAATRDALAALPVVAKGDDYLIARLP